MEWNSDMNAAPKDGASMLLYCEAWAMSWDTIQVGYYEGGDWIVGNEGEISDDDISFRPTHWMPLPSPPEASPAEPE